MPSVYYLHCHTVTKWVLYILVMLVTKKPHAEKFAVLDQKSARQLRKNLLQHCFEVLVTTSGWQNIFSISLLWVTGQQAKYSNYNPQPPSKLPEQRCYARNLLALDSYNVALNYNHHRCQAGKRRKKKKKKSDRQKEVFLAHGQWARLSWSHSSSTTGI